ncbi:uncharacterized protein LOC132715881 [Ruditapes philippinarum]|uniref:uncharacterized protein LOC132715881 n=1 Tax=Ruditapes philippinarum TaxID=129788 RepID=UPI00295BBEA0|nr:uncharacterized protein LOC132715881 [Ruditapes philippinarum]
MEASTVAKILVDNVITRFGIPNNIHSDQGSQFESKLFRELCNLLQIKKTRTTPYHAQSDGMVERFNKTLASMLSNSCKQNAKSTKTVLTFEESPVISDSFQEDTIIDEQEIENREEIVSSKSRYGRERRNHIGLMIIFYSISRSALSRDKMSKHAGEGGRKKKEYHVMCVE